MTKKDYIKLAKLIKDNREYHAIDRDDGFYYLQLDRFVQGLCDILQDDNLNFDQSRFMTACQ